MDCSIQNVLKTVANSFFCPSLVTEVPEWGYAITKQECANHALKFYRASSEQLVKDKPQCKVKHKLTTTI